MSPFHSLVAAIMTAGFAVAADKIEVKNPDKTKDEKKENIKDEDAILGSWKLVGLEIEPGKVQPLPGEFESTFTFLEKNGFAMKTGKEKPITGMFTLIPSDTPKALDLEFKGRPTKKDIYELDGDKLKIAEQQQKDSVRPKEMKTDNDHRIAVFVYERITEKKK